MTDQRIIYQNDEGGVSVIIPAPGFDATKDVPAGKSYKTVDVSSVPSDRSFRNAWKLNGDAVDTDMEKARDIQRDNIRAERKPLLEALDLEWLKAAEAGDTAAQADVAARKQALRDAPNDSRLDTVSDPTALKALTLNALLG